MYGDLSGDGGGSDQLLLGGLAQIKALFLGVPTSTIDQPRNLANKNFDISLSAGLKCRPDGGCNTEWEIDCGFVDALVLAPGTKTFLPTATKALMAALRVHAMYPPHLTG